MKNMAHLFLKRDPAYRAEAFYAGLVAAGYMVDWREPRQANRGDVIVIWNKGGLDESRANAFEKAGGTVLVAENGYFGTDIDGNQLYAISEHGHNGSGRWTQGVGKRWDLLNTTIKPWRLKGQHILICPNRYIGSRLMRQPADFIASTVQLLQDRTERQIRIRPHPGNWQVSPPKVPIEEDLENAWACVIWASSAGVRALVAGIPVICLAPNWICQDAATDTLNDIEWPKLPDREPVLERMAWAQWTLREISLGTPFEYLQHKGSVS